MSEQFRPHYASNIDKARLHVGEAGIWLEGATERMNHVDWLEATDLLKLIRDDVAPRLSRLRENAEERLAEYRSLEDYPEMRAGRMPYPDEWPLGTEEPFPAASPSAEDKAYVLDAPSTHVGEWLIRAHGGDGAAEALDEFEAGTRQRQDALAFVYKSLLDTFKAGTYEQQDILAFANTVREAFEPGAGEWQSVLEHVNKALDEFEPGARQRQDILAWLYRVTGKRPDSLILPTVKSNELGRLVVSLENTIIYEESDEDKPEPEDPEGLAS